MEFINKIMDLGPTVVLPILVFFVALIFRTKFSKALTSAIKIGVGFVGINLVIGLLSGTLGEAAKDMASFYKLGLDVLDVGWPASSAIAFGTKVGALAIPIGVILNVLLLILGLTKTLDIDLWNFWHAAFISSIVYIITGSLALAILANVVYMMFILLISDLLGAKIGEFYGFSGITFPHGASLPGFLVALPLNFLFDKLHLDKFDADPEKIQKKFGVLADTSVIGLLIGLAVGIFAKYSFGECLILGIETAAIMLLMPKMVALLMEGLMPISEAAQKFVHTKFKNRDIYIGMDSALSVGHPAVLSSSLILIPITILLAIILPGNKVLPFGDLATIPFFVCLMAVAFKGNLVKTILGGSIYMALMLYVATWASPYITSMASEAGMAIGSQTISSLCDGGIYTTFLFGYGAMKNALIFLVLFGIISLAGLIYVNKIKKN